MYKDETHQYLCALSLKNNSRVLQLKKINDEGDEVIAEKEISKSELDIELKIISDGISFSFQYKDDSDEWNSLASNIDASYLSTSRSYGFTGTTIGLYASQKDY